MAVFIDCIVTSNEIHRFFFVLLYLIIKAKQVQVSFTRKCHDNRSVSCINSWHHEEVTFGHGKTKIRFPITSCFFVFTSDFPIVSTFSYS